MFLRQVLRQPRSAQVRQLVGLKNVRPYSTNKGSFESSIPAEIAVTRLASFSSMKVLGKFPPELVKKISKPASHIKVAWRAFYAGETIDHAKKTIINQSMIKVKSVLQPAMESTESTVLQEENIAAYKEMIDYASGNAHVPFIAIKPTAFMDKENIKLFAQEKLTLDQISDEFTKLKELNAYALKKQVPLFWDAEQAELQPGINRLFDELFKTEGKSMLFNTEQLYLKEGLDRLKNRLKLAEETGKKVQVKVVKGAYAFEDAKYTVGSFDAAHQQYKAAIPILLDAVKNGYAHVIFATHNDELVENILQGMRDRQINISDPNIYFGQLYGMRADLTFSLAIKNANIINAIFFGPEEDARLFIERRMMEAVEGKERTNTEIKTYIEVLRQKTKLL